MWVSATGGGGVPPLVSEGSSILASTNADVVAFATTAAAIRTAIPTYGLDVLGTSADQSVGTTVASLASLPFLKMRSGPRSWRSAEASIARRSTFCKGLIGFNSGFSFTPAVSGFSSLTPIGGNVQTTVFVRFWDTNTVEYLVDGDLAVQCETNGTAFARATLLPVIDKVCPGAQAAWDGCITQSSWTTNPFTKGSYAAALPGQNGARTTLAQPIGNLWFAGEALAAGGSRGSLHECVPFGARRGERRDALDRSCIGGPQSEVTEASQATDRLSPPTLRPLVTWGRFCGMLAISAGARGIAPSD